MEDRYLTCNLDDERKAVFTIVEKILDFDKINENERIDFDELLNLLKKALNLR